MYSDILQQAIFIHLTADAVLSQLVPDGIVDALPELIAGQPLQFVAIGTDRVSPIVGQDCRAAMHYFPIEIVTQNYGFSTAKAISKEVERAMATLSLGSAARLVALHLKKIEALRGTDANLRIIRMDYQALISNSEGV